MDPIPEQEIMDVLKAIERREVTLSPAEPKEHYFHIVKHVASNGWQFYVYDDAGEWDYIDHVVAPDGRELNPWLFLDEVERHGETHDELHKLWSTHWTYLAYERLREYSAEDLDLLHLWPGWDPR